MFNPEFNLHPVKYEISNCPEYNGLYHGKGIYLPAKSPDDKPQWLLRSSSADWINSSLLTLED
ncbi:hypothetical protein GCM10022277_36320 [Litoribacillus peritrichatus]|uniref:Uncharacterized protein n=1 Tax=Litoribacillus peritrichatus TaxID=718191 RepID=A0ABP7N683_9GAMM